MYHDSSKKEIINKLFIGFYLVIIPASAISGQWKLTPILLLSQSYTDNLELVSSSKKQDYITEVDPRIKISGAGARIDTQIDYTMQNLYYAKNQKYNKTNHQLNAIANTELIKNNFFFDVDGGIEQTSVTSNQPRPVDNINVGNRTNVKRLSMTPYFKSSLQGNALTEIRYTRSILAIEEGASSSSTDYYSLGVSSGPKFTKLAWNIAYDKTREERESGDIVKFENAVVDGKYQLIDSLYVLAKFGYANNDFQTVDPINNGNYESFGIGISPNDKLSIEGLYSTDYRSVSTVINPTKRTSLKVAWRDSSIGLNTGKVWRGDFNLNIRRTSWLMTYQEDTTTTQQLQLDTGVNNSINSDFGLTDDVFERKLGRMSFKYLRPKSQWNLSYYNETRRSKRTDEQEKAFGASASVNWRLGAKTNFSITGAAEKRQFINKNTRDNTQFVDIRFNRNLKKRLSTIVGFHRVKQDSDVDSRAYQENRVFATVTMEFTSH